MSTRNFSLFTAGLIWILVGIRIGSRGLAWLQPYFENPDWKLSFLLLSVIIGLVKGLTVLKKAVLKKMANLEKIDDHPSNYFIGWLKLFGVPGTVIIILMIGIGITLRYLRNNLAADPNNIFGFIYLGIAMALIGASIFYFREIKPENK
jgi:hypothetical protein